jgi:hypothetical protein
MASRDGANISTSLLATSARQSQIEQPPGRSWIATADRLRCNRIRRLPPALAIGDENTPLV